MSDPRRVAVVGSTGSVGRQALEVLRWHPWRFRAALLAAGSDSDTFRRQVLQLRPSVAVVGTRRGDSWVPPGTELGVGPAALIDGVIGSDVDVVLVASSGLVSLRPTLAALRAGKTVAVANKETLVSAGHLATAAAREHGATILPVDSEHSAIWQTLRGEAARPEHETVRRILLTASGGAFRDWSADQLSRATPVDALRHPNWVMGPKITVDSATMMNKGLEVIEASWLFGQPVEAIEVLVHRESVIHSLVEFIDGSVKAQLATPDMRLPIQYALGYPDRLATPTAPLDLVALGRLTFEPVDAQRFPCLNLAYGAARLGDSYPAALNAANEESVRMFLNGALPFQGIAESIAQALDAHVAVRDPGLAEIEEVDIWARRYVREQALSALPAVMIS